jgi:hypothetical protein
LVASKFVFISLRSSSMSFFTSLRYSEYTPAWIRCWIITLAANSPVVHTLEDPTRQQEGAGVLVAGLEHVALVRDEALLDVLDSRRVLAQRVAHGGVLALGTWRSSWESRCASAWVGLPETSQEAKPQKSDVGLKRNI